MVRPRNIFIDLIKRWPFFYDYLRHQIYSRFRTFKRREIFHSIYRNNSWDDVATVSGIGSSISATEMLRSELPVVVQQLQIKSLLDIPCGDFFWMRDAHLELDEYIGADIVAELVDKNRKHYPDAGEFICLDLLKDALPSVDAVFCRDCLVHLSLRDVRRALRNIKDSAASYLMTTTFPECTKNIDTVAPYWRPLNFEIAPFNFPKPLLRIKDFSATQRNDQGKYLGVWKISDL
jgi:Methyltransferase domain